MKTWRVWILMDANGTVLAKGRKREVMSVFNQRYVYGGIYTDRLYKTAELLMNYTRI